MLKEENVAVDVQADELIGGLKDNVKHIEEQNAEVSNLIAPPPFPHAGSPLLFYSLPLPSFLPPLLIIR